VSEEKQEEKAAFICSRDTLDGVYPSLILGISSRRLGMRVKIFYTFMGLNVLRKGWAKKVKFKPVGPMGAIPGMPELATWMMKSKIDKAEIPPLDDLLEMAELEGVELVGCKMTVDMMACKEGDLIEGCRVQNAEEFLKFAKDCKICLFT
jgi:peroxiredoxin family protein